MSNFDQRQGFTRKEGTNSLKAKTAKMILMVMHLFLTQKMINNYSIIASSFYSLILKITIENKNLSSLQFYAHSFVI